MTIKKTDLGHQVVKDRSVPLTPQQRTALILVDGKKSREKLVADLAAAGVGHDNLTHLRDVGLIEDADGSSGRDELGTQAVASTASGSSSTPAARSSAVQESDSERYAKAYPIATRIVGDLGFKGFRLNLAVEAALNLEALRNLAPKIRAAAGAKADELDRALGL